jgi:RHS repeat-associated protein
LARLDEDWRYSYDGLDRVLQAQRGVTDGAGVFANAFGSKTWTLDETGNWTGLETFGGGAEPEGEWREHNAANQLKSINQLNRFYDANGNLLRIAVWTNGAFPRTKCTFDAWNRLVKLEQVKPGGIWDSEVFAYNGLNWRVKEVRHVGNYTLGRPLGAPPTGDSTRWSFYSLSWQELLEVVATTATPPVVTGSEQQVWGLRGTDDAVLRRFDTNADGVYGDPVAPSPEPCLYQLTDSSFSPIDHLDAGSGLPRQRMSYDTYGQMKYLRLADHDGDGTVTESDRAAFWQAVKNGDVAGDYDGNGTVNDSDYDQYYARWVIESQTSPIVDEVRVGYGGYIRDPITGWLLARNRWYDPLAGRWVTRDPAGYVDGMSLYLYAKGNPLSLVDPMGLKVGSDYQSDGSLLSRIWDGVKGLVKDYARNSRDAFNYDQEMTSESLHEDMARLEDLRNSDVNGEISRGLDKHRGGDLTLGTGYNLAGDGSAMYTFTNNVLPTAHEGAVNSVVSAGGAFAGQVVGAGTQIVGELGGEGGATAGAAARGGARAAGEAAEGEGGALTPTLRMGKYGELSGDLPSGVQANHLNQDAVFGDVIPRNEGLAAGMKGNAFTEAGTPHYQFHQTMEQFWNQYRPGGVSFQQTPTHAEDGAALQRALQSSGVPPSEAGKLAADAASQRAAYGLKESAPVPRIPGRMNQKR